MKRICWLLKRILTKIYTCFVDTIQYIYEMVTSIFDRRIRISFTNFWSPIERETISGFLRMLENSYSFNTSSMKKYVNCRIVQKYNPQIQLFSVFGDIEKVKSSKTQVKVFFCGENVELAQWIQYKGNCIDCVDLSLGFNYMDADNYIRLPEWFRRYFLRCSSKDEIKNILNIADKAKRQYPKLKFCSLISSHDVSGLRTKIYNNVTQIASVDCPGKLLHNDDTLHSKYNDNKHMYLQPYKFNICPENSIGEGYCTEKLFDCLFSGCIPIYNGYSKDPEPDIINPNIILWYDELDEENNRYTLDEIKKLHENDKRYRSFLEQPFFCDTAVDKIYDILNNLNEKIREILICKGIV